MCARYVTLRYAGGRHNTSLCYTIGESEQLNENKITALGIIINVYKVGRLKEKSSNCLLDR